MAKQYTLKPLSDSDMDSMFILPLSVMPLTTPSLQAARLIKNGHLQSVVELFHDDKTGSGQVDVELLPARFHWNQDETHPDHTLIRRLALLPSYDVYSLRISLRQAGIALESIEGLRLTPEKAEELSRYMVAFTRPLLQLIFADEQIEIKNYSDVLSLFRDPDLKKVRDRLNSMATSLNIKITEVPSFLEDYGDTFLSISYFRHCLDRLAPYFAACIESFSIIRTNYQCKQSPSLMRACDTVETVLGALRNGLKQKLDMIETRTQQMFRNMNQEEFQKVRAMVQHEHLSIGSVLCGLTVKMELFGRLFPHEAAGGPLKRGDFMLNDMVKSIDKIRRDHS